MKKRILSISIVVLVVILALFLLTACNADTQVGVELVSNGNFEKTSTVDSKTTLSNWYTASSNYKITENSQEYAADYGSHSLQINNNTSTHTFLYQQIKVDRKKIYKVTYNIKVSSIASNPEKGSYISFKENPDVLFVHEKKTTTDWVERTFYVKPMDSDYLTVCLNLQTSGDVYFDNVSMQRVDSAPSTYKVEEFYRSTIARYNSDAAGIAFVVLLAVFSVLLLGVAYVALRKLYATKKALLNFGQTSVETVKNKKTVNKVENSKAWYLNGWFIFACIAALTFVVRLICLLANYGFGGEMTRLVNIAQHLSNTNNVINAYVGTNLTTTSPGTIYILAIIGSMGVNLSNSGISILIRMVGVLADIAVVAMIYFYGKKYVGNKFSTIFSLLYALLPISFVMSGINGTFESLLVAMMLLMVILTIEKQYLPAYLVTVLAIMLDIRALAIVPILVTYMGYMYYRDNDNKLKFTKNRIMILSGFVASFALLYILTLPVSITQIQGGQAFFNFKVLANMMTEKTTFVINALNLYGMVGMNMKTVSSTVSILNLLFIMVFEIYVVSLYFKNKNKQEIILLCSLTMAVLAVFTLKIDYTYLFLSLALGFVYTMISGDKRMYGVMSMYSILAFLCIGQVMNHSGFVSLTSSGYMINFETTSPDFIIFCVLAVLTTLYYVYVSYSITTNGNIKDIVPMPNKTFVTFKNWCSRIGGEIKETFSKPKEN